MKNYLLHYNQKILKIIKDVGRIADEQNIKAYLVGGSVRDILLKRKNLDVDIVVEGDAIVFAKEIEQKKQVSFVYHQKFGTASGGLWEGISLDLASARKERYASSGALPTVQRGMLKEDLFRRDFTINAMAIGINRENFGTLIDLWGGGEDLKNKKIRVLHSKSFEDDPTRILRAIRFEQRFGFKIERQTYALLKEALRNQYPLRVKPPRYFNEFKKILQEDNPVKGLERLKQIHAIDFLKEEEGQKISLSVMRRIFDNKKWIQKNTASIWLIYFMSLVFQANHWTHKILADKFQFKKEEKMSMMQLAQWKEIYRQLSRKNLLASEVYLILKRLTVDNLLCFQFQTQNKYVVDRIHQFLEKDRHVMLKVTGEDLKHLGCISGKEIGSVLKKLRLRIIDGGIKTKQQELTIVKKILEGRKYG